MGIGAIAGLAAAAVSAGTAIYGAVGASQNSPQAQGGAFQGQLKNLANKYLSPQTYNQAYWTPDIASLGNQSTQLSLAANQAGLTQLTGMLNQVLPGYQGALAGAMGNASQLISGQLPADVVNQIQRSTAFDALRGGFAGTGASGALTARDLGLTKLQLSNMGTQQLGSLLQMARTYAMPQMLNPLALLPMLNANDQWTKTQTYNAAQNYVNLRSQGYAAQYGAPYQSSAGSIGGAVTGLLGYLGGTNQQTGTTQLQSIANLIGGSGGGGGAGASDILNVGGGSMGTYSPTGGFSITGTGIYF